MATAIRRSEFGGALAVPFLILLPLSYELRFMSPGYIRNRIRNGQSLTLAWNSLNYLRRIRLFFKAYQRVARRIGFDQPLLTA